MFLALGLLTAVVGALFCFRERHIKRLLAFSTISHAGMFLAGIALLTPLGLAGAAVYVAGHALVKAALFLCVGIVLHRLGSVNETWLHGRGRRLRVTGVVFTLAALGLADLPPFATFLGKGWIEDSAADARPGLDHRGVHRSARCWSAARCCGWPAVSSTGWATRPPRTRRWPRRRRRRRARPTRASERTPLSMIVPAAVLAPRPSSSALAAAGLGPAVQAAAVRFQDQGAYNAAVLSGAAVAHPAALHPAESTGITAADVVTGAGSAAGALILACCAVLAAAAAAAPRAWSRARCWRGPIRRLPERRGQRLRDLDRRRRGLHRRGARVRDPLTGGDAGLLRLSGHLEVQVAVPDPTVTCWPGRQLAVQQLSDSWLSTSR